MKNEVGLKHIALELGISMVAVSRALKDCDDISEQTKQKVRQKAIELGYVPRPLEKSNHKTIAILVDSLGSSFFGMIAEKLIEEFKKFNCLVNFIPTSQNFVCKENVKEALEISVDGIISFLVPHQDAYEMVLLHRVPFLLFGRYVDNSKMNIVYMDDYLGGEIAASYLIDNGADKLCYVGVDSIECSLRRQEGFINKGKELGIKDIIKIQGNDEMNKVEELINTGYKWYFCFDDSLANYLINSHKEKDIHVVGFNGSSKFLPHYDFITSIHADYDLMVKDAVKILIDKINNKNEGDSIVIKHKTEICK